RTIAGRGVFLLNRMIPPEPEKLLHCYFLGGNGETSVDPTLVTFPTLTHPEHTPLGDNHHRLSLPVDVPLPLAFHFAARQFPVDPLFSSSPPALPQPAPPRGGVRRGRGAPGGAPPAPESVSTFKPPVNGPGQTRPGSGESLA